jgi:hypothetical protein
MILIFSIFCFRFWPHSCKKRAYCAPCRVRAILSVSTPAAFSEQKDAIQQTNRPDLAKESLPPPLLLHLSAKHVLTPSTLQRYDIAIAVHECAGKKKIQPLGAVILVIWSFGQNRFSIVKIRHYNINIYIYYYSEQK